MFRDQSHLLVKGIKQENLAEMTEMHVNEIYCSISNLMSNQDLLPLDKIKLV